MDSPSWSEVVDLVQGLVWPIVVVFGGVKFAPELRALSKRLLKAGAAEFGPPPQVSETPTPVLASSGLTGATGPTGPTGPTQLRSGSPQPLSIARSSTIQAWEGIVRSMPGLAGVNDQNDREEVLVNVIARLALGYTFEVTDLTIWASQIALLEYLSIRPEGESAETLRRLFYEPAKEQYPEPFKNYSFDSYIAFLERAGMVMRTDDHVRITEQGKEFLAWRVATNRPPRPAG